MKAISVGRGHSLEKLPNISQNRAQDLTMKTTLIGILLSASLQTFPAARILALFPTPSPSHHIWNRALMSALVARGHQVTVLSPNPEKTPVDHYTDVLLEGVYDNLAGKWDCSKTGENSPIKMMFTMFDWGPAMCQHGLRTKGARRLMETNRTGFDLIIAEVSVYECYLGFVDYFNYPPVMAVTPFGSPSWVSHLNGNPDSPSYVPNFLLPYSDRLNFPQRMMNLVMYLLMYFYRPYVYMPRIDKIAREHFGESLPSVSEIERNISVILVNTHVSMDYSRPLVPGIIPVGGLHITPSKPLPQDLQKYLDEAKDGVIFFSLGSNVRSDGMLPETIAALIEAFKELPQRILWKFESDTLPGQPKNVKISKWLPQNDILGHPNVRLFITHCGLLSSQETIYHGVPVVAIPFFVDQHLNAKKMVDHGVGEMIAYHSMTKVVIINTIRSLINNSSYRENMKRISFQFRDQPETPLERAIYWTEYVIRHKGAHHLRTTAIDMPWYQYLLLDVILVLALLGISLLVAVWLTLRTIYRLLSGKTMTSVPKINNNNYCN